MGTSWATSWRIETYQSVSKPFRRTLLYESSRQVSCIFLLFRPSSKNITDRHTHARRLSRTFVVHVRDDRWNAGIFTPSRICELHLFPPVFSSRSGREEEWHQRKYQRNIIHVCSPTDPSTVLVESARQDPNKRIRKARRTTELNGSK